MIARYLSSVFIVCLAGCASLPPWLPLPGSPDATLSQADPAYFNFDWQLSGDQSVAPLQIFDNGAATWLQFPDHHVIPAIFETTVSGQVPLAYRRHGPYVVLDDVWPELAFRGGHLHAVARRLGGAPLPAVADPSATVLPAAVPIAEEPASTLVAPVDPHQQQVHEAASVAAQAVPATSEQPYGTQATSTQHPVATTQLVPGVQILPLAGSVFAVSAADLNLRKALERWSAAEGWTFSPEHWAVDVDIPIAASAAFETDFIASVQALVASTELSDHPLQPCFYANRVLRVVAYTRPCDRTSAPAGGVAS